MPTRVVVIGGGPAGLLCARLLARSGFDVLVYERRDPVATYGFGVALAGQVLERLRQHDPEAAERIAPLCHPLKKWTMRRGQESASVDDSGAAGIARTALLRTLQALADEAGARIENGTEGRIDKAAAEAEIVVLADGVGSLGRNALAARLGAKIEVVPIPYMWCGSRLDLDSMTLDLRRTPHGLFCAHVMPYGNGDCTFQVDTVSDSLRSAGLAQDARAGDRGSDEASLGFLSDVFSSLLGGSRLLANRSRWNRFRLVTCERWSDGKIVLLGDAAHTAHYTVGSGTRMAMEDAIVFSDALAGEESLDAAFAGYEAERRPAVEHLQWRARRSQTWWRTLSQRDDLPLPVLLFSYFTRTGSVGLERLARSNPHIVQAAVEHRRREDSPASVRDRQVMSAASVPNGDYVGEILERRVLQRADLGGSVIEASIEDISPWSRQSLTALGSLTEGPAEGILLTGAGGRRALLDRFDIAEELRTTTSVPVTVLVSGDSLDDAATAIVAGRADYVMVEN